MDGAPERFGSYLVYEQLGKGGMASVHRAELQAKGETKQVALKRLIPSLKREVVALFLDEARLQRYLKHPNIPEVYDSGRLFGSYFIAMEYVRGPTLKELVAHCGRTVGAVPQQITLNLAAQLCDALDYAHNRRDEHDNPLGIIHRDVTPANIIVSSTGRLKLIDFGLAKAKLVDEDTGKGVIKGKYGYIAPEYLGGELDHRADLWAVGIIMYELLTSRRLFDGTDAYDTVARVRQLPIPRPSRANPRVTPELDAIVMTALERSTERRWQSAAAMRDALRQVIDQPGNFVDDRHVVDWVDWVFTQAPGTEESGLSHLASMVAPPAPPPPPLPPAPEPPALVRTVPELRKLAATPAGMIRIAIAVAIVLVVAIALVWKLVG